MMNEPLHTIMQTALITVTADTPLSQVRDIFMKKHVHHIPVLDGKTLIGLVTTWDLFRLGISAQACADVPVGEIMTSKLSTLSPDDHIGAAAEIFLEHLFHALPIVNDQHELVGMITTYDILKYEFVKEYSEERKQAEMLTGYH
jgi:acetoin utilization protein AcuB